MTDRRAASEVTQPPRPPQPRVRVLVVDDSRVARHIVADMLRSDPGIEVIGNAADGNSALEMIESLEPDVVTLDVDMPGLDGLGTLAALRRKRPWLPVLMVSALTERAASVTLDALANGANDYVTKPSGLDKGTTPDKMRDELVRKVKALGRPTTRTAIPPRSLRPFAAELVQPAKIVVLASSAGGPNALHTLVSGLPADLPVPILIVQHMPPVFTRLLARRLDGLTPLSVREAEGGERPAPGEVWLAPGDHHMEIAIRGTAFRLVLNQGEPENSCRPAADPLFRSAVALYGADVLGVVLTGMGQDGLRGVERIREAGGRVVVQDAASSVVWGMPGAVSKAGLADAVLPIEQIAGEIVRRTRGPYADRRPADPGEAGGR